MVRGEKWEKFAGLDLDCFQLGLLWNNWPDWLDHIGPYGKLVDMMSKQRVGTNANIEGIHRYLQSVQSLDWTSVTIRVMDNWLTDDHQYSTPTVRHNIWNLSGGRSFLHKTRVCVCVFFLNVCLAVIVANLSSALISLTRASHHNRDENWSGVAQVGCKYWRTILVISSPCQKSWVNWDYQATFGDLERECLDPPNSGFRSYLVVHHHFLKFLNCNGLNLGEVVHVFLLNSSVKPVYYYYSHNFYSDVELRSL